MIEQFIESNFEKVIRIQGGFDHDEEMIQSVKSKSLTNTMVKNWMRSYGLYQGLKSDIRIQIADEFISFSNQRSAKEYVVNIEKDFNELHSRFYAISQRKWLSACSKLLWCINPYKIIIYDAFVERAIAVLQCIDADLAKYPRINYPPKIIDDSSGRMMTIHYLNYQNIVNELLRKYKPIIDKLKLRTNCKYEYDVRIIDKLLWIMGDLKSSFTLGEITCESNE